MSVFTSHSLGIFVVSLAPVFVFLYVLFTMDSYKLIPSHSIVIAIGAGLCSAVAAFVINVSVQKMFTMEDNTFPVYVAPWIEECCKAAYVVYLLRRAKIGFPVDAALYSIAVGAGFGFVENIYYLHALPTQNILVWIIRGFGTSIMHGGATAIFGILGHVASERNRSVTVKTLLPGYLLAVAIHSFFNRAFFSPVAMTLIILVTFPALFVVVFQFSQKSTKKWLQKGLDSDIELLEILLELKISDTRIGRYLQALRERFPAEAIGDMLCLLRMNLELSMHAKGVLMLRESGIEPEPDLEVAEKLNELRYLQKSIGKTGMLALAPFLPHTSRDVWQFNMMEK